MVDEISFARLMSCTCDRQEGLALFCFVHYGDEVITDLTPLAETDLDKVLVNYLRLESIVTVGDLTSRTERELYRGPNIGARSMRWIRAFLANHGLSLKEEVEL